MEYRIITHGGCIDGFFSAYVMKKYFNEILKTKLSKKDILSIPIIQLQPGDIQREDFDFQKKDIVLDLPEPKSSILFWCDHHSTAKPDHELKENQHWDMKPSCAGYLLELLENQGVKLDKEMKQFKEAIDINDSASYTKEQIKECFYPQESYDSPLQKLHVLSGLFRTRDRNLNDEMFQTLLGNDLGKSPLSAKFLWSLHPLIFHRAQLEGFRQWRENIDSYMEYDQQAKCVIQDDRKAKRRMGNVDRFYAYMKHEEAAYGVNLKQFDEETSRMGIGCNIFHKERCLIDIGELCKTIAQRFGDGSGGGHPTVGGATIHTDQLDNALAFVLECLKNGKITLAS